MRAHCDVTAWLLDASCRWENLEVIKLPLENERQQGAALVDAKLSDFVNYRPAEGVFSAKRLSFQEEVVDNRLSELRPFGHNSSDPFLIAFHRR